MSLRTDCATPYCGHDRDTHYREVISTHDLSNPRVAVYRACLASKCDCRTYTPPTWDED